MPLTLRYRSNLANRLPVDVQKLHKPFDPLVQKLPPVNKNKCVNTSLRYKMGRDYRFAKSVWLTKRQCRARNSSLPPLLLLTLHGTCVEALPSPFSSCSRTRTPRLSNNPFTSSRHRRGWPICLWKSSAQGMFLGRPKVLNSHQLRFGKPGFWKAAIRMSRLMSAGGPLFSGHIPDYP